MNNIEICEECNDEINCNRRNIYIVTKGDDDKVWCQSCFEVLWEEYSSNGWGGEDIDCYSDSRKESDKDSDSRKESDKDSDSRKESDKDSDSDSDSESKKE